MVKLGGDFFRYSVFGNDESSYGESVEMDFYNVIERKMDTKAKKVSLLDIQAILKKEDLESMRRMALNFIKKLKNYSQYLEHNSVDELIDSAL